jgi:hypothetical protein
MFNIGEDHGDEIRFIGSPFNHYPKVGGVKMLALRLLMP